MGKQHKRKKTIGSNGSGGSGGDSESDKKEGRGPSGDNACPVSAILGQTNSVLFDNSVDNDSVFSVHSSTPAQNKTVSTCSKISSEPSNADIFTYLQEMNQRLVTMESKLQTLDVLKVKVDSFEKDIKKLWTKVQDQHIVTTERINAAEERVDSVEFSQDKLCEKLSDMESANRTLKEEIVYLQSQSMRNNLIFANIQEEEGEDLEVKLRKFFVEKMSIAQECADRMVLERVHRMGGKRQGSIRSIVAKFHEFKDRELVRRQSKMLKGTHHFVNEQFPKEIADRRRTLVPKMKEARQQGKRSWISYDTLYIDGRPVRG